MESEIVKWLNWLDGQVSDGTRDAYAWDARRLAKWAVVQTPQLISATGFSRDDLTRYLSERKASGVGGSSRKRAVSAMRSFFGFMRGRQSPARKLPYPKVEKRLQRTLTAEEVFAVLAACDTSTVIGKRDVALFGVLGDSGIRVSELVRLDPARVDLKNGLLQVACKGGQEMFGLFGKHTASWLSTWLSVRDRVARPGVSALFVGVRHGGPLTREGVQCLCRRVAERAGVVPFSPHAWRRTAATQTIENGASTRIAMELFRWKNVAELERYTQALRLRAARRFLPIDRIMSIDGGKPD